MKNHDNAQPGAARVDFTPTVEEIEKIDRARRLVNLNRHDFCRMAILRLCEVTEDTKKMKLEPQAATRGTFDFANPQEVEAHERSEIE